MAAGAVLAEVLNPRLLSVIAGVGFIVIGIFTLWQGMGQAA